MGKGGSTEAQPGENGWQKGDDDDLWKKWKVSQHENQQVNVKVKVGKWIAEWAKAAALKHNQERMAGRKVSIW